MNRPELLAPAGDLEKLKMAIVYGADAVYLGGEEFGLRKASKNFTLDEIDEGVKFAHDRKRKVYVTLNIIPHNEDLTGLDEYVKRLDEIGIDGVIVADAGIFSIVRKVSPKMPIHLSTQANVTNIEAVRFWYDLGVRRIVLARELSLEEIIEIKKNMPSDLELETFVHGAMCISYSGRCLLSNYMAGRDSNRGECAHPCRWKYYLMEEKRPGEYYPIYETDNGSFIFNSKDLCMIEHIPELVNAGISSFKIEGRVKSQYYVATIVRAYRMALDEYFNLKEEYEFNHEWIDEIKKASYRDFTTGFYFGKPTGEEQVYTSSSYIREYDFVGLVLDYDSETGIATIEQRNRMFVGDEIEVFGPKKKFFTQKIDKMWDEDGNEIDVAPHPQEIIRMKMINPVENWDIIRCARKE